ncbi:beta-ketoacyl-[acyl-carrier-protein] synthase family protein [Chryseolinea serpens]|uniref:beta-ketoacyl-[acyl-carrier-protein] synthase family protein n=1 Tax=Chryseolinea serpens TaxID=947013 RepID=UPI001161279A|nr:beta-ketoacyl-[acyl-carrier-protein] synthase family protein [Chryseolinea serpens]
MKGTVHVAGTGIISAIGNSVSETLAAFQAQCSGIGHITLFDSVHKNVLPVGEVKLSNEGLCDTLWMPAHTSRTALLGIYAAREAVKASKVDIKRWRTGVISATTVGGMDRTENFFIDYLADNTKGKLRNVLHHECGMSTELIADDLGVNGFISTINTACSSSVNAIALGSRLIKHNQLDVVIAGGTDALSKFTLNGFNSLMILDQQPCRPFDASRAGLNLGEGAAFVVLVSDRVLEAEKIKASAYVNGYANTNDAYHQTASSPEGRGSFGAMQKALAMSGLSPQDIDYINLHGTGTLNNDLSEGTAIARLYGDRYPRLSSTKAFTGHTLGASGGIEAVFSVMAIREQCVFPNLRFETPIPEVGIVPQKSFESGITVNHVMSNSFGFGGNCSSIIFSKN